MLTLLEILGSLGVFLYGMKITSEGVQKTAGDRMRTFLATMTKNRFAGLFTGMFTTCLLQSSSVTTVITVSFVSAGLLTLLESVGVIMGANLGTTVTAWLIAFVPKFKIGAVALPLVGLGIPFIFAGKGKWKSFGETLIGFGLLFLGLVMLKDAVPDVQEMMKTDPGFATSVQGFIESISGYGFFSLLLFVAIGTVLTVCVQSSSAAMAITVMLALNGWINLEMSMAIVLGENIGTTVTAWLASLGATVNAKRAARVHFLFNMIGVCWMLLVFNWYAPFVVSLADMLPASVRVSDKLTGDLPFTLAIFHTTFNLINICLLIGFAPQLAKIVECWVKDTEGSAGVKPRLRYISQSMVDVGELNLPEAENAVRQMAVMNLEMMDTFLEIYNHPGENKSAEVVKLKQMEKHTDQMLEDITSYLVKSSTHELDEVSARSVASMFHAVSEMEQVGDCIRRLTKLVARKYKTGSEFLPEVDERIKRLSETVREFILFYGERLFSEVDDEAIARAKQLEKMTNRMRKGLRADATERMRETGDPEAEMLNIDMAAQLERIGNHALNIMESSQNIEPEEFANELRPTT